jgi:hypothetical protein
MLYVYLRAVHCIKQSQATEEKMKHYSSGCGVEVQALLREDILVWV